RDGRRVPAAVQALVAAQRGQPRGRHPRHQAGSILLPHLPGATLMSTVISTPDPVKPAYRDGSYLRYTAGHAVSIVGDQVWYVALSWSAVQLASPAVAGIIMTVSALPRLVLLMLGGVYVD